MVTEEQKIQKEIWAKAIDTQMHFNEMSVKSRQLGLSFVVAALGVAVVLLGNNEKALIDFPIPFMKWAVTVHVSVFVVGIAAAGVYAVRRLDLGVYHQMLRGAVKFGEELERSGFRDNVMKTQLGMTEFISLYSRHETVEKDATGNFHGKNPKVAGDKIGRFYSLTINALLGLAVFLAIVFFQIKPKQVVSPSPPAAAKEAASGLKAEERVSEKLQPGTSDLTQKNEVQGQGAAAEPPAGASRP